MKFTRRILSSKDQRGVAIIMAVFCLALISYIVTEVSYETNIEYNIHSQAISRLKAYYAARAGLELSLLRVKMYRKIQAQFGQQMGSQSGMLNLIWSFPMGWPPTLPDAANLVEKDSIKDKVKDAQMDATYTTTIIDEGSKIDINDLDSPSKSIREVTKKELMKIFEWKMLNDPDWAREHQDLKYEDLIDNIADWVDSDKTAIKGGDERQFYPNPPKDIVNWPPNRAFRTLEELRLVAGMKDEYFKLYPRITIYGAKALNPNTASREVLQSLDPSITDLVVGEVLKRRDNPEQGGFFTTADDFWNFVNQKGGRVAKEVSDGVPLIFGAVTNFRIRATGEFHGSIREIEVAVFDLNAAASAISAQAKKDAPAPAGGAAAPTQPPAAGATAPPTTAAGGQGSGNSNQTISKGPPRIVYWSEK